MSLKTIEKYQKYTPLVPYAVGGVAIGALALGGYYIYIKIRDMIPSIPDIDIHLPSWLQTPITAARDPLGHAKEGEELKKVLQEAYDKAVLEYDRRYWDNAVVNIPAEKWVTHPFLLIWVQTKTLDLEKALEARIHEEVRPRDPYIVSLEEEIATLQEDRATNLHIVNLEKAKVAAEKALQDAEEKIEQERVLRIEKTLAEQQAAILRALGQMLPAPVIAPSEVPSPYTGLTMTQYYQNLGFQLTEVQFSQVYGEGWSQFKKDYGGDNVNERVWSYGISPDAASPNWVRVRVFFDLTGQSPSTGMVIIDEKWMFVQSTPTTQPTEYQITRPSIPGVIE